MAKVLREQFINMVIKDYLKNGLTKEDAEFDLATDPCYIESLAFADSLDNLDEIFGEIENIVKNV